MKRLGAVRVLDKQGNDTTAEVLSRVANPSSEASRRRAAMFLVQRCGYTQARADAVFDKKKPSD